MVSLAAYIAGLAGGGPQDGPKAAPASAPGAAGLFAALLQAGGSAQAGTGNGEGASPIAPFIQQAPGTGGKTPGGAAAADQALSGLLGEGLESITAGTSAEAVLLKDGVDAVIIEGGGEGSPAGASAEANVIAPELLATGETSLQASPAITGQGANGTAAAASGGAAVQAAASNTGQAAAAAAAAQANGAAGGGKTAQTANGEAAAQQQARAGGGQAAQAQNAAQAGGEAQQTQAQAQAEGQARAPGLETAQSRAAQPALDNGLQTALGRAVPAQAGGEAQALAAGQARLAGEVRLPGEARQQNASNGNAEAQRAAVTGAGEAAAKPGPDAGRPQAAPPRPHEIIQRIVTPGAGQSLIRVEKHPGGETAATSSPPTLTVNVQAHAASPGPAQANAPHVPVGALAVHIAQQAHNGARRFDIRLDPPELGRIEVRLDVARDGKVTTHLVVERSETLDLLQRDARQLERALQNAGLNTSEEGMKFSLKDQGFAGGDENIAGGESADSAGGEPETPDGADIPSPGQRYTATGGLDIRI